MRWLAGIATLGVLFAAVPATAAAKGCPSRDVRTMLAEAGQGFNGRVVELREAYITVVAESTYAAGIRFDDTVRVYGRSLPAVRQGRIGIVVRREGGRWTAGRCDVVPGWRMANALSGMAPCPAPRVRVTSVRVDGLVAHVRLRLIGDVTTLRTDTGRTVRRRQFVQPGFVSVVETSSTAPRARIAPASAWRAGSGPAAEPRSGVRRRPRGRS